MDTVFSTPSATAFDSVSSVLSAGTYLVVALAAFARAPRDLRVRVFLATALASAAPYGATPLMWARGADVALTRPVILLVGLSLMMGSVALLHFSQVFPWRRPWIRAHGRWVIAGYIVVPILTIVAAWATSGITISGDLGILSESGGLGAVSGALIPLLALLVVALPVIVLLGIVVPFAALLSLYKSWLTAKAAGVEAARVTTFWILISQMGGGALTILIIPLLHLVAPTGPWVTMAATLLFACGLLMPLAFAAGIWKYRVLELDPDRAPAGP